MLVSLAPELCCPICRSNLDLHEIGADFVAQVEIEAYAADRNIERGVLICGDCRTYFPIERSVPVLLVFSTNFHRSFARNNRGALASFPDCTPASGSPEQGERYVQESFTDEWNLMQGDDLLFRYTHEEALKLHKEVWLRWDTPPQTVKRVLDLGCGYGKEAEYLAEIVPDADVYAVDLNFSLLNRPGNDTSKIRFVIASVFHLPFRERTFDLAYTEGVIHHTYSTKAAFDCLEKMVAGDGYYFVWVYGKEDAFILGGVLGLISRLYGLFEAVIRRPVSVLPRPLRNLVLEMFSIIFHPLVRSRQKHQAIWKLKNSRQLRYDRLGPRYAWRHGFNEVLEWFEKLGYRCQIQSSGRYRELFGKRLTGVGFLGKRD